MRMVSRSWQIVLKVHKIVPKGGDFVYFFVPGPGFRKNFLPGGSEFDYLKKFPGGQPGGGDVGAWN